MAEHLLEAGWTVAGFDGLTDYYDVTLKERRLQRLGRHDTFTFTHAMLEDAAAVHAAMARGAPDVVIHLAAQAGVRYALQHPRAFLDANIIGSFNVMEAAHKLHVQHLLMASTSSAYGANTQMPFDEHQKTCTPLSLYAATKLATEAMGHSHAHIHGLPITMFRFFTVYGPWGRPDMAPFKFTKGILEGTPIDIYNHGQMWRDFTYVTDLVRAVAGLVDAIPGGPETAVPGDSLSPAAPYRVVNIGNSQKVRLEDFIEAIEQELGRKAIRNYLPMQPGEVPATWADAGLLHRLTGHHPQTPYTEGVTHFVRWFRDYHAI